MISIVNIIISRIKVSEPMSVVDMVGRFHPHHVDSLVVHVDESVGIEAQQNNDKKMMKAASRLPGVYWKVGHWCSSSIFRQEPSIGANNKELFIWHSNDEESKGWWISEKPIKAGEMDIKHVHHLYAFCPSDDGKQPPHEVHAPYWNKKATPGIHIQARHQCAETQLKKARTSNAESSAWIVSLASAVLRGDDEDARDIASHIRDEHEDHGPLIQQHILRHSRFG